jgi:hypothetical protein
VIATNFWPTPATIQAQAICASGSGIQAQALQGKRDDLKQLVAELRAKLD